MKSNIIKLAVLALSAFLAIAFGSTTTLAQSQSEDVTGVTNMDIMFYNPNDAPGAVPYLQIRFENVPNSKRANIANWRTEISDKLETEGGVHKLEDYKKVSVVVNDYFIRFMDTGATSLKIIYPRIVVVEK